jgi:hypothetical protein
LTALGSRSVVGMEPIAPAPDAPLWLVIISVLALILSSVSSALHIIAPRTKSTLDDRALSIVDRFLAWLRKLSPLGLVVLFGAIATTGCVLAREVV